MYVDNRGCSGIHIGDTGEAAQLHSGDSWRMTSCLASEHRPFQNVSFLVIDNHLFLLPITSLLTKQIENHNLQHGILLSLNTSYTVSKEIIYLPIKYRLTNIINIE